MIDWVTLVVPYNGPDISGGSMVVFDESGVLKYEKMSFKIVEGSWSCKSTMLSVPDGLYISGNPAKYLQGHNIFGSDNLMALVELWCFDLFKKMGILDLKLMADIRAGNYDLKRVDVTFSFDLGTTEHVRTWLQSAKLYCSSRYQKTEFRGGTLYSGKSSKRKTIKLYSKWDEIDNNKGSQPILHGLNDCSKLKEYAKGLLRVELTARARVLKEEGLGRGHNWQCMGKGICPGIAYLFWLKHIECLQLPDKTENLTMAIEAKMLKPMYRSTYELWLRGYRVQDMMSKASFYRHRKYFMTKWGIDIGKGHGDLEKKPSNVVFLRPVLVAKPCDIPIWAQKYVVAI